MSMILIFKVSSPELKALNHKIISQCKYFKILPTKTSLWIKPLNLNKRIYSVTNFQFPGTTQFWSQESQDHAVPNEKRFKAIWFLQDLLTIESIHITGPRTFLLERPDLRSGKPGNTKKRSPNFWLFIDLRTSDWGSLRVRNVESIRVKV